MSIYDRDPVELLDFRLVELQDALHNAINPQAVVYEVVVTTVAAVVAGFCDVPTALSLSIRRVLDAFYEFA